MLRLLREQEEKAQRVLRPEVHDYYAGGTGEETTVAENTRAWRTFSLRPRVLQDVAQVSTHTSVLGAALGAPVLVAPTALHGLAHPEAEAETARGVAAAQSLLVLSTRSSLPLEQVAAALGDAPWWLQVYVLRNRSLTRGLVQRAAAAGARALLLTGDTPYVGVRARPGADLAAAALRIATIAAHTRSGEVDPVGFEQDASATLDVIGELASLSGLPVLVKGVLRGDDAAACLDAGAAGVVVSNHGGRQLDRAVATAYALGEVVSAVGGRAPVLVDGGVRSGLDVLVALALGADAVLLGRPVLWALASGGAEGVRSCLDAVRTDLAHVLALAGARSPRDLPEGLLMPRT